MNIRELYSAFDMLIPPSLSCEWDNDGLMLLPCGEAEVHRALITLDVTPAAAAHAVDTGCDVIISHHPLIFRPLSAVTDRTLVSLIKANTAVMSFHTRLDAVSGGVNHALADALGLTDTSPLTYEMGEMGLVGTPHAVLGATEYARHVKAALGADAVTLIPSERPVRRVAVLGGAGKDFISAAVAAGADVLVTGEAGHHARLDAEGLGLTLIEAGHYETEFPVCRVLRDMLQDIAERAGAEITSELFDSREARSL